MMKSLKNLAVMFMCYLIIILIVAGLLLLSYPILNPNHSVVIKGLIIINFPIIIYILGVLLGIHKIKDIHYLEGSMVADVALHTALFLLIIQLSIMVFNS
jgi:hypothetical protein